MELAQYRSIFVEEARRQLHQLDSLLSAPSPNLTALFRGFHTLKGMSATMRVGAASMLAHSLEDLCAGLQQRHPQEIMEALPLLKQAVGALRAQIRQVEEGVDASPRPDMEESIRAFLQNKSTGFTLLTHEAEAPEARLPRVDEELGRALAELMAACAWLREQSGGAPEILATVGRMEGSARQIHRVIGELRQLRLSDLLPPLRRKVRQLSQEQGKEVRLDVEGEEIPLQAQLLGLLQPAIVHLLINAVVHGIEPPEERKARGKEREGRIALRLERAAEWLMLTVSDDGQGFDEAGLRAAAGDWEAPLADLVMRPGVSTAETTTAEAGRGLGVASVYHAIQTLGGSLDIQALPGAGARFVLRLPARVDLVRMLLVEAGGRLFAIPSWRVASVEPRQAGDPVEPLLHLGEGGEWVVWAVDGAGWQVERVLGRVELPMIPAPTGLERFPGVLGSVVAPDGRAAVVVDPSLDPLL